MLVIVSIVADMWAILTRIVAESVMRYLYWQGRNDHEWSPKPCTRDERDPQEKEEDKSAEYPDQGFEEPNP